MRALPAYPWQKKRHWALQGNKWEVASIKSDIHSPLAASHPPLAPRPDLTAPYVAPQPGLETELAEILQEILQVDRVGIHDSFFELGGHSLLAAQVISRIASRVQVDLPLRELFNAPTIATLVERIQTAQSGVGGNSLPPIVPAPRNAEMLPSFTQEALWFLDQLERGRATYTIYSPVRIWGRFDFAAAEKAVNEIFRRHEALRTRFPDVDGRPLQVIEPARWQPLAAVDLSQEQDSGSREQRMRQWIADEMSRPIDLQNGPLIRITMIKMADDDHVVMVSAPPHDLRRLVDGRAAAGAGGPVCRVRGRKTFAAARTPYPVCRFCRLAASMAAGRRASAAAGLLGQAACGRRP